MDATHVTPFVDGFLTVMPQLGFANVSRGKLALKEKLTATQNVTGIVGLSKQIRGNVAYSMSESTAKSIASTMMMGMEVAEFDEMAQSAISELMNMVTANSVMHFEQKGIIMDISPPVLIVGENVTAIVCHVKTIAVEIITDVGTIEVNIGLEI